MNTNELVSQAIPRRGHATVDVTAQLTECPYLVITPSIGVHDDGRVTFRGTLTLTHTRTGASLVQSNYVSGLEKLASSLSRFDWEFDNRDHFKQPENRSGGTRAASNRMGITPNRRACRAVISRPIRATDLAPAAHKDWCLVVDVVRAAESAKS